jgi:hypothetical protein
VRVTPEIGQPLVDPDPALPLDIASLRSEEASVTADRVGAPIGISLVA